MAWWFNACWRAPYEARTQKELEAYIHKRHEALAALHSLFLDAVSNILRVALGRTASRGSRR